MQLEIARQKENKTLNRTEVELTAQDLKLVPSRKELKPKIAAMLNTKEELLVITKIGHSFGSREITVEANVYKNVETLKSAEAKHLLKRDIDKKKKGEDAAPKPEEAKAGEEKEDGKKDEKPAEAKKKGQEKTDESGKKEAK